MENQEKLTQECFNKSVLTLGVFIAQLKSGDYDNITTEHVKVFKEYTKGLIKVYKNTIKKLKAENKEENKETIKAMKKDLKALKAALWTLRIARIEFFFIDGFNALVDFVGGLIKKLLAKLGFDMSEETPEETTEVEVVEDEVETIEVVEAEIVEETVDAESTEVEETEKEVIETVEETVEVTDEVDVVKYVKNKKALANFFNYLASNFKVLNEKNEGLFRETREGAIVRASKRNKDTVINCFSKGFINVYLTGYVKDAKNVDKFINYVIKNNVKDFSKVTQF